MSKIDFIRKHRNKIASILLDYYENNKIDLENINLYNILKEENLIDNNANLTLRGKNEISQ